MHLVRDDDSRWEIRRDTPPAALELIVREPATGTILVSMALRFPSLCGQLESMRPAVTTPGAGTDALQTYQPVVGSIAASQTDLHRAIERWLSHMQSLGCSPRTLTDYRAIFRRAVADVGWLSVDDVTHEAVTGWLGAFRASGEWSGATYNRNLSVFRSFTAWARTNRLVDDDPLERAERAVHDGGEGSRAATTEEGSALILQAWCKHTTDAKCKGNRPLYWHTLFTAACRLEEPTRWRREHLHLSESVPQFHWTPDINKTHRDQYVALSPELVPLLRAHLEDVDRDRAEAGLEPAGPKDLVFPIAPSKHTWPKDEARAGIAHEDYRGRIFSPHSARKWFSTTLTAQGVPEKMVDFLMRHAGRVEHRYYDPPLAEQAAALALLPPLWPQVKVGLKRARSVDKSIESHNRLTSEVLHGHDRATTLGEPNRTNRLDSADQTRPNAAGVVFESVPGLVSDLERRMKQAQGKGPAASSSEPASEPLNPTMGIQGLHLNAGSTHELADFLEALAKLIRSSGAGHEGRTFGGERSRA